MKLLVLGASGFIGSSVAARLAAAGHEVVAGARRPEAARRLAPAYRWVAADFAGVARAQEWATMLEGVEAVVNCVGALQDGAGESVSVAHETGPAAMIAACEAAGVRRLIHISAVGVEDAAGTTYARSKLATERTVRGSGLVWVILRPSLVIGRAAYGGTALMRGLAALPLAIPVIGGGQRFRPIALDDLAEAVVRLIEPEASSRVMLEVGGPEPMTLAEVLAALRAWLGLSAAPVIQVPRALAWPVVRLGDLLGWLGWPSSLRTTSLRQMDFYVEGDSEGWVAATGVKPATLGQWCTANPATSADRWQAKLYFVRPISVAALAVFWLLTGLISLGPGYPAVLAILQRGGFGGWSPLVEQVGSAFDILMGLALLRRRWTAAVASCMCIATAGYLVVGTLTLPQLWADPLGPWLKVIPMMALCLFVAATEDRR